MGAAVARRGGPGVRHEPGRRLRRATWRTSSSGYGVSGERPDRLAAAEPAVAAGPPRPAAPARSGRHARQHRPGHRPWTLREGTHDAMTAELLRDLIDIPERVHAGDFVLTLSKGVDAGVHDPRLRGDPAACRCFDDALGLIQSAVERPGVAGGVPGRLVRLRQEPLHGRCCTRSCAVTRKRAARRAWWTWSPSTTSGWRAGSSCWCPTT